MAFFRAPELFGFELADYDRLFEEKLELFARLRAEGPVTWSGTTRAALPGLQVYPHTAGGALPTRVGVGGNPASVVRAARYGFSLMLAIIGGNPARFARLSTLYRAATDQAALRPCRSGCTRPGTSRPPTTGRGRSTGPPTRRSCWTPRRQRGFPEITREYFDHEVEYGSLYVGSPDTVARRIVRTMTALDASRFDLKYGMGPMPHAVLMENIRLFGTEVAARVREQLKEG